MAFLFYGLTLVGSVIFARTCNWQRWQDPRKRLLHEEVPAAVRTILLGDSVWISGYVSSEKESIWRVLEEMSGQRVFNATLNGADPADFLNAVELFPQQDGQAIVFLDIVPTRLLVRNYQEPVRGNYAAEFSRLTADHWTGKAINHFRKPLLLLNTEVVINCLLHKHFFSVGDDRERTWSQDGDLALRRFRTFESLLVDTDALRSPDWIREVRAALEAKGYRLVIVITPINRFLLREYAQPEKAQRYETRITRAHHALVEFLERNGLAYLDCSGDCASDCFADLIHTNVRGDRLMARKMADYLRSLQKAR